MRAVSLFSGAGGFEIGLERAGIQTVLQAENDPWCLSVLERHWPECERVVDVRKVDASTLRGRRGDVVGDDPGGSSTGGARLRGIDLVYGGFPCQDLSVAGNRAGFRGQRSSLWFEFQRVLSELQPQWCLIENVPGLLSSANGRDMATILGGLGELGYGWAYRVLDARWFGVPQRRRRVFIVGCLGDAARAQAVLAVCESCGGHPQTRREAWQDVAPTLDDGARRASVELPMIAFHSKDHGQDMGYDISPTVRAAENENGHHGHSSPRGDGADNLLVTDPISAHEGKTYTHEGKNNFRTHNVIEVLIDTDPIHDYIVQRQTAAGVRRLTPLECERLQGWPDGHTRYTAEGKEIPDSHRYRMIGNGVASPCAEWIGHRLMAVWSS